MQILAGIVCVTMGCFGLYISSKGNLLSAIVWGACVAIGVGAIWETVK